MALHAGNKLVVRAFQPRPFELAPQHKFVPRQWYHIAVVHAAGGALASSTVSLFVDGAQVFSERFKHPKVGAAKGIVLLAWSARRLSIIGQVCLDLESAGLGNCRMGACFICAQH